MPKWLSRLWSLQPSLHKPDDLAAESQAQALRLELTEAQQTIQRLKDDLERQRLNSQALQAEQTQAQMEDLLHSLAAPAAQFITQIHLSEIQEKPIQARDVLAVAQRLVRILQEAGLTPEGTLDERLPFDPDRHEPLSAAHSPSTGQIVRVRFVGFRYHGKLLRKASVSPSTMEA